MPGHSGQLCKGFRSGCLALVATTLATVASAARAAELSYSAYELGPGEDRKLIGEGAVDYAPARDIRTVRRSERSGETSWTRALPLPEGFLIATTVTRWKTGMPGGFGLTLEHSRFPLGFSWEWFDRKDGAEYDKRQGEGRIRITVHSLTDHQELAQVEFLTDVTLRFCRSLFECKDGKKTHLVVVKAGSLLDLGPAVTGSTSGTVVATARFD
jgi:hypothetical protein